MKKIFGDILELYIQCTFSTHPNAAIVFLKLVVVGGDLRLFDVE